MDNAWHLGHLNLSNRLPQCSGSIGITVIQRCGTALRAQHYPPEMCSKRLGGGGGIPQLQEEVVSFASKGCLATSPRACQQSVSQTEATYRSFRCYCMGGRPVGCVCGEEEVQSVGGG